ncbi:MAG: winged helix-turn-helix domain-containing protein [Candidatus Omnitrophica bacterium]|nr:winged helix-turn-helix domain-containing protein [Candidatus Omnitrophota bacterium]
MKNSFVQVAIEILKGSKRPLMPKEITDIALKNNLLKTHGKTPDATMGARIYIDIKRKGPKSYFIKTARGQFLLNKNVALPKKETIKLEEQEIEYTITEGLSSRQKGDIAEARVAELIVLYGDKALSCYKPISDDEGIDLIVKEKGSLKTLYLQTKSRFELTPKGSKQFIQTPSVDSISNSYKMALVFVYFDVKKGDIHDKVWFVPAPDFIQRAHLIPANKEKKRKARYRFNANIERNDGRFGEFLIDKRDLANTILRLMAKI